MKIFYIVINDHQILWSSELGIFPKFSACLYTAQHGVIVLLKWRLLGTVCDKITTSVQRLTWPCTVYRLHVEI